MLVKETFMQSIQLEVSLDIWHLTQPNGNDEVSVPP